MLSESKSDCLWIVPVRKQFVNAAVWLPNVLREKTSPFPPPYSLSGRGMNMTAEKFTQWRLKHRAALLNPLRTRFSKMSRLQQMQTDTFWDFLSRATRIRCLKNCGKKLLAIIFITQREDDLQVMIPVKEKGSDLCVSSCLSESSLQCGFSLSFPNFHFGRIYATARHQIETN